MTGFTNNAFTTMPTRSSSKPTATQTQTQYHRQRQPSTTSVASTLSTSSTLTASSTTTTTDLAKSWEKAFQTSTYEVVSEKDNDQTSNPPKSKSKSNSSSFLNAFKGSRTTSLTPEEKEAKMIRREKERALAQEHRAMMQGVQYSGMRMQMSLR